MIEEVNSNKSILVVDRSKSITHLVAKILKAAGYEVDTANSGAEAKERFLRSDPAVIVMSLYMPDINGPNLLDGWRKEIDDFMTPVIFLTAAEKTEDIEHAFKMGAFDYITKPPVPSILTARVANAAKIYNFQRKLRNQALIDPMTKLYNRRYLNERMPREIGRARRYEGDLSVAIMDIDFFKKVNDNYGHDVGDDVIIGFATTIAQTIRQCDVGFRLGGEEFFIAYPETSPEQAVEAVQRIRDKMNLLEFNDGRGGKLKVTFSAGVARLGGTVILDDLIKQADKALYYSKENGRNQTTEYSKMITKKSA